MSIRSPDERVYYYECSAGKYRLTYHIPYSELMKLVKENKIKKQVQDDFPDGVDLRVSETDYKNFNMVYGYRPEAAPWVTEKVFSSFLYATKDWRQFRGSGLIPAKEIDQKIPNSTLLLTSRETKPMVPTTRKVRGKKILQTDQGELKRHRLARENKVKKQKEIEDLLNKAKPEEINPTKSLQNQNFQIRYTEGERIEDMFSRIQHKRRPKP